MATVTLTSVRMGLASDLANQLDVGASSIDVTEQKLGGVRMYANGRVRAIGRSGVMRQVAVNLWVTDRTQLDSLLSWAGSTVLYRDPRGRKVWGVYYDVTVDENIGAVLAGVSLTLSEITYDEAV